MKYINILLSSAKSINIKNNQLRIVNKEDQEFNYPIEDINSIVLENHYLNLSSYTLAQFAKHNIACFVCDEKHTPSGVFIPFNTHFEKPEVLRLQLDLSKPIQKRLWQSLVKQKILNQGSCLEMLENTGAKEISLLANDVQSGDATNIEAIAARKYFLHLFGADFTRVQDSFVNAALNYCYSIVRGCITRTLAAYGFEPALGLGHSNMLNAFNLADDLIEPFRAICDLHVVGLEKGEGEELKPHHKQHLIKILQMSCKVDGQKVSISYAIDKLVESLKRSMKNEEVNLAQIELIKLEVQKYE
ncbi:MAG: type II CRISPR-associated endonuclease Cas1 [Firmicutes bacterium]|nr:type II CRISPR-associated endonuclease Cas1 [Bacillota bacterium]